MGYVKTPLDDLTYAVNGLAMQVQHELQPGHRERIYQWALAERCIAAGLQVDVEKRVEVYVNDSLVGYLYLDLWIEQQLVAECKAFDHPLTNDEIGQVIAYLAATGSPVGMLYNFGRKTLEFRRILPPKNVQEWHQHLYRCIWTPPSHSRPSLETVDASAIRFSVISSSAPVHSSAAQSVDSSSVPVRSSVVKSVDSSSSAYAASGVNIDAGNRAVELMSRAVRATYGPEVLAGIGAFGGLFDAAALKSMRDPVLVASTDGVGTKVKLAAQTGRYESIGHDIVNHCINDILVQGARPLFFLDYIASATVNPDHVAQVVSGMAAACHEAGCALLGGETAEMPGVYAPNEFDLVGTIIGVVDRADILPRPDLCPGDVLIGLRSSGPHTNGYALIRKTFAGAPLDTVWPELGLSLADALLAPHRSYRPLITDNFPANHSPVNSNQLPAIKALAHITGGGFMENIPRVLPEGLAARVRLGSWPIPPLFRLIQSRSEVSDEEMYHVFNMGIGMIAVVALQDVPAVQAAIGEETWVIGELVPGERKTILS
ncbi:MAG TPA: phosphoribosylformylglycinamidine cyclo-ligase [Anaerolineae bacterium]|nr:phosphoribosylformylglycinamidine cyclo-ligase [Anaerolineae bacterium]